MNKDKFDSPLRKFLEIDSYRRGVKLETVVLLKLTYKISTIRNVFSPNFL